MITIKRILLFIIALILSPLLVVGFVYAMIVYFWSLKIRKYWNKIGQYFFTCAIAIDQAGNVFCSELFNDILIRKDGHLFGDEDETISSVLGKNKIKGTLTYSGKMLDALLNIIDNNHSIDSIE